MGSLAELTAKFQAVWPLLDERTRRLMAANEAMALGYGGVSLVHRASGLSRNAIAKGIRELEDGTAVVAGRVRRPGAGRPAITVSDPRLVDRRRVIFLIGRHGLVRPTHPRRRPWPRLQNLPSHLPPSLTLRRCRGCVSRRALPGYVTTTAM